MKIKLVYILNILFISIIIALIFTPMRNFLGKFQSDTSQSKTSNIKTLTSEQFDIELKGVNTPDTNLKYFKGKKIFLHFWGTWCPPCKEELPSIQKFYDKKKDTIQFVLIYIKDEQYKVSEYIKENSYTFPIYDAISLIDYSLLPKVFPTTYLLDEKGNVIDRIEGSKDWDKFNF